MTTLTDYQTEFQELVHDPNNTYFSVADMNLYINRARLRISGRGQCCRILLSGGTVTALTLVTGGSGYSGTPTVTVTGLGQQAQATATISGSAVNSVTLVNGGWGYINGATVSVVGSGGGTNAVVTATVDNSLTTVPGQEVYQFSLANTLLAAQTTFQGLSQVQGVISVAGAWGANAAMKPMLMEMIWSEFQAYYRSYNTGLQSYPTVWSKYNQGANGSIYLWPLPSQASQMDWDCWVTPIVLTTSTTFEAMPHPWTTPVAWYAAYQALFNAQRFDDADRMKAQYEERVMQAVTMTNDAFMGNYYEGDY